MREWQSTLWSHYQKLCTFETLMRKVEKKLIHQRIITCAQNRAQILASCDVMNARILVRCLIILICSVIRNFSMLTIPSNILKLNLASNSNDEGYLNSIYSHISYQSLIELCFFSITSLIEVVGGWVTSKGCLIS